MAPIRLFVLLSLLLTLTSLAPSMFLQAQPGAASSSIKRPIDEGRYVSLGGMEQWVTIKGNDRANPIILFVHGGPGNPMSLYSDSLYRDWFDDFTVVHWDQRYAGRTYELHEEAEELTMDFFHEANLTIELLVRDGLELSEYLVRKLDQPKLILSGTSWGSVVSVHIAKRRPELFYAYVGVSQLVHGPRNLQASYGKTLELARRKSDDAAIKTLEELGPPPWENPRNFGRLRRLIRAYEAAATSPYPDLHPGLLYDNEAYRAAYVAGEDVSFLKFVGLKNDGMASRIDLFRLGTDFSIPVILIQGAEDLLTTPEVSKDYFDRITAPAKHYALIPAAGHDPNLAMLQAQRKAIMEHVLPLLAADQR